MMKKYKTPTLSILSMPREDILNASGNLLWGGIEEFNQNEQFGDFVPY